MTSLCKILVPLVLAALPAAAEDVTIIQKDKQFSQKEITIKVGDKVTFKNADDFGHSLFSLSPGMQFPNRTQAPGDSSSIPFNVAGTVEVHCAFHPGMKLMINVKK